MKIKRKLILWADDDWMNYPKSTLEKWIVEGYLKEQPCFGVFHYRKNGCYEGKPRKVEIIIREI